MSVWLYFIDETPSSLSEMFLINDECFSLCFDDWILCSPLIVFLFDCFKISDRFYESMKTDLGRLRREFYTPEPISLTGNYYPRYQNILTPPFNYFGFPDTEPPAQWRLGAVMCLTSPGLTISMMFPADTDTQSRARQPWRNL